MVIKKNKVSYEVWYDVRSAVYDLVDEQTNFLVRRDCTLQIRGPVLLRVWSQTRVQIEDSIDAN